MKNTHFYSQVAAFVLTTLLPKAALAGGAALGGASEIALSGSTDVRQTLRNTLFTVLSYVGLLAVAVICIAGITYILNGGNDSARERAKNIIIYTIVGLIVILLASAIINFFGSLVA